MRYLDVDNLFAVLITLYIIISLALLKQEPTIVHAVAAYVGVMARLASIRALVKDK